MYRTARTRARASFDTPLKATGTPLKHRHAVTPVRHPPKRRRIGMSSLAINRLAASSDSDLTDEESYTRARPMVKAVMSPYRPPRTRGGTKSNGQGAPTVVATPFNLGDVLSPRKRKRHDPTAYSPTGSDSWVETEDEAEPDFIADDDQHLLHDAGANSLRRLRKDELIRLWKVAGMWLSEDEGDESEVASMRSMGKNELVDGLIKARKVSSSQSLGRPISLSSHNPSSALTSPPDSLSGDDSPPEGMELDVTPKANHIRRRTRGKQSEATPLRTATTRVKAARARLQKPKGKAGRGVRARPRMLNNGIGSEKPNAIRSSSASSYATTADGSTPEEVLSKGASSRKARPVRRLSTKDEEPEEEARSRVGRSPLTRRLRPRNKGSPGSNTSGGVEADAEDNGDEDEHSPGSSTGSGSRERRPYRKAKLDAIKAMSNGGDDGDETMSEDTAGTEYGTEYEEAPVTAKPKAGSRSPLRKSRGAKSSQDQDVMAVDDEDSMPTTRSGRAFREIRDRRSPSHGLDDHMDVDRASDLSSATLSSLTRLRRDELVHMCEARSLEIGGTKPQLARALIEWRDGSAEKAEVASTSSQSTARPLSVESAKVVPAVASHSHVDGIETPVLLRTHVHAHDPPTPQRSEEDPSKVENDLNLDLQELGLEDFTIKPEQLVKLDKIGSGGFKDVYVGKLRGRKVAISEFRDQLSEMDIKELKLLAEFSHPNIVRFRGISIPEDTSQVPCMLVSELCENGDLYDYIRNVDCPPQRRVLQLMLDIARGLEYLHLRKPAIIHRDCKSTNILINSQGVAKVGDFGLARVKHSTRSMIRSLVGTVNWQAPELWHPNPRYDYKVDVFSAALVYWEMLSGWMNDEKKYPWEGFNEHYIYDAVGQKHKRPSVAGLRKFWGAEPVNLMQRMWHQDPAERPTMSDVVADLEALIADC